MNDNIRLRLYWQRVEETSVLTMRREDWNTVVGSLGVPVAFDVSSTPMASITKVSSVIASVAYQFDQSTARIQVFRSDPQDAMPVNQDEYDVWTDLRSHPKFDEMITAASTENNENLKTYCRENVFLVKRKPGPDHWLSTLPSSVSLILKSS